MTASHAARTVFAGLLLLALSVPGGLNAVDRMRPAPIPCAFGFVSGPIAEPLAAGAAISWENEQPGGGQVFFGTDPSALDRSADDGTTDVRIHVVLLPRAVETPLLPSTQYFFRVRSTNSSGEVVAESDILAFTTLPAAGASLGHLTATPKRIGPGESSVLSAELAGKGKPVAGAPVTFTIESGVGQVGGGMGATVLTDAEGRAQAVFTAGPQEGKVRVRVTSPADPDGGTIRLDVR